MRVCLTKTGYNIACIVAAFLVVFPIVWLSTIDTHKLLWSVVISFEFAITLWLLWYSIRCSITDNAWTEDAMHVQSKSDDEVQAEGE